MKLILQLIIFIGIGVLLTAGPEWQLNLIVERDGFSDYFNTLQINAVLLFAAFWAMRAFMKRYRVEKAFIVHFTVWAVFGLLFEWILIHNHPASDSLQYGMFIYWGVFLSAPALFVLDTTQAIRSSLFAYIIGTSAYLFIGSLIIMNAFQPYIEPLFLFTLFSWMVIFTYILTFFFKAFGYPPPKKRLFLTALVMVLTEILLPFPFGFIIFIAGVLYVYRFVVFRMQKVKA